MKPVDPDTRDLVSKDVLRRTLFVEAGAGTGKTTQLVDRIANLVLVEQVPLRQIAVALLVHDLVQVNPDDGFLAFSFPRYSVQTVRTAEIMREQGAKVVVVTDSPLSPAAQHADAVVTCESTGYIGTENSLVSAMAVMNALLNGVIAQHRTDALDRYERGSRIMEAWDAFLLKSDPPE